MLESGLEIPLKTYNPSGAASGETQEELVGKGVTKKRRTVVVTAIFALCIDALAVRSISLLAPFIRSDLQIDEGQFGFVVGAMMAGTLLAVLPVGALIDRLDARWTFPLILTNIGLAFLAVSFQNSFYGLLAALFVLGLLRAGIIPLVNRVITGSFDRSYRGAIMGIIYAAVPLGGFLGAIVLPALSEYIDWNTGYRVLGLIALLGGLLSRKQIPNNNLVTPIRNPLHDLVSLRSRAFLILAIAYGFYALSLSADVFVTLFLVDVVKISALASGTFFGLIQLTGVGGRMFWGFLADQVFHKNRSWLLAIVNWLTVISFVLLIWLNANSAWWMIATVMVVIGMSVASSWGILSTVLGDMVDTGTIAIATSAIFFVTNIADILGPVLFGATLNAGFSYQKTMSLFMVVAICTALILTWAAWHDNLKQNVKIN